MRLRLSIVFCAILACLFISASCMAQVFQPLAHTKYYLIHSSGNVLTKGASDRAVIDLVTGDEAQLVEFVSDGAGYYWIKPAGQKKYLSLSGTYNSYFLSDSTTNVSKYAVEKVTNTFVALKCKSNSKYLGTDNTTSGSSVYSDKSGSDSKHYWYISQQVGSAPVDTFNYVINPAAKFSKPFEGWGISLCWWANMCGKWSDDKIDQLVDWLVSPNGLNYNIFRYNIGGGDDPHNRNCTPHHMGGGKGLRAEMEGFKDSLNARYDWNRDAAQRKIMLKIKEKRPDAIFEAFSNSAPYYMTYSGCCAGNKVATSDNLKPEYYTQFADYLVDVCKFYKDSFNIEFKTLEPFNEPVTNYWSANGGQEGCYFSVASQIAFLKVLAPVLKVSGLNTIISASDETSAAQSVVDFKAYLADGKALDLVGQWNTHTYTANNQARATLRALATAYNKTLWMSEVGAGGTGIAGNLSLAQKLMDDIRYIRPEAWVDWQYMEENNDQWCHVRGSFSAQTYERVKNYYVRQQFSRYIPAGSRFLAIPNNQMLAAFTPSGDSLVVVAVNNTDMSQVHAMDLSLFKSLTGNPSATRTSGTENNAKATDFTLSGSVLHVKTPARSITTVVIPILTDGAVVSGLQEELPYLIVSRTSNDVVVKSSGTSTIVSNYFYGDSSQVWKLSVKEGGYSIKNLQGLTLTDTGAYYLTASPSPGGAGQIFNMENTGDDYYKITSLFSGKVFDLEGATSANGTKVGLYAYGTSQDAVTRQWMFVKAPLLKSAGTGSGVEDATDNSDAVRIIGGIGAILLFQVSGYAKKIMVYTMAGEEILKQDVYGSSAVVPIHKGIYLVCYQVNGSDKPKTVKVLVR